MAAAKKELDWEIISVAPTFVDGLKDQIAKVKKKIGKKFVKEDITAFGNVTWIGWYEK